MCPTIRGRLQTRVLSLPLPALLAAVLALATANADWLAIVALMLLVGVALDVFVYRWLISYQPPWLSGAIGLAELGYLFVLAHLLSLRLTDDAAVAFYLVSWCLATATRIAIFPILSLTYLESAGEFRRTDWTIPVVQEQVSVLASAAESGAAGPLLRGASGVHAVPLTPMPGLSGVFAVDLAAPPDGTTGDRELPEHVVEDD